jgi:hypothetical protein
LNGLNLSLRLEVSITINKIILTFEENYVRSK